MYQEVALGTHLYIRKTELGSRKVRELREELTLIPRGSEGPGDPVYLYDERTEWFGIPLYHLTRPPTEWGRKVHDLRSDGRPIKFEFKSTLRPGQEPVINAFETWLQAGATGFLLEAKPGFGKTVTVLKMLQMLGRTALIIVPRSNLVGQWIERIVGDSAKGIKAHTSLKRNEVGWVNGSDINWRGKKLVVGLVHSLALDRLGDEFRKYFGVVVPDEVDHSIPPSTFAPVLSLFPAKYRIGASAEMKRFDGLEVIFHKHIGQVHLKGVAGENETMTPKAVIVNYPLDVGKVPGNLGAMQRRGILLSKLAKSPARNLMLARYIRMIYNSERRVVVLSDRVQHLLLLRDLVEKMQGIPKRETGMYVGSIPKGGPLGKHVKMTAHERKRVASDCRVIFATYQMFALGTDIQDLAGLIYATPQSEIVQSKGRIERALEGKKEPVLVDVVDSAYKDAERWAAKRMAHYRSEGMTIKRVKEGG
jgi:superfamily II DNA or RNA helicase